MEQVEIHDPVSPVEPFRNIVPTVFTMNRVVPLLKQYSDAVGVESRSLAAFAEWQLERGGIVAAGYARANRYPLKTAEFDLLNRGEQAIEDFANGGYESLLRLVGRICPSF